ncbi:DUF805 domain-containing protein [Azohydromonas aeria]|uniref:DUF805 domain-containing protein n=1 Tax=Azohydromonas aeria TaxID=2590212 RepID=UPI0018E052C4|nr:DUF805 domain-containing protein [Azohydromonas aeria]
MNSVAVPQGSSLDWFITVVKKYAVFHGRAGRAEYWYFTLIWLLISVVLTLLDAILGTLHEPDGPGLLSGIFTFGLLLPSAAVTVRRLHDTDRRAWWMLLLFVPFVGPFAFLALMAFKGTPGENRFGTGPGEAV